MSNLFVGFAVIEKIQQGRKGSADTATKGSGREHPILRKGYSEKPYFRIVEMGGKESNMPNTDKPYSN